MEQTRFDKVVIGGVSGSKVATQNIIRAGGKSPQLLTPTNFYISKTDALSIFHGTFRIAFAVEYSCDFNQTLFSLRKIIHENTDI